LHLFETSCAILGEPDRTSLPQPPNGYANRKRCECVKRKLGEKRLHYGNDTEETTAERDSSLFVAGYDDPNMARTSKPLAPKETSEASALLNRKGAVRTASIPTEVLAGLHEGSLPTVNLVEWLAIDAPTLLEATVGQLGIKRPKILLQVARESASLGIVKRYHQIATALDEAEVSLPLLSTHRSDTLRCWAAFVAVKRSASLSSALEAVRPFALDDHFGVREIAWLAWRPQLASDVRAGLDLVTPWTKHPNENARRFASEATRPRGVWCEHLGELKAEPELAVALLNELKSDPSLYVRKSVANWLNDASKTQPRWVEQLCARWKAESKTAETIFITKGALRTLTKPKTI
jgi:3-methyladenine DNA glycosylase AlkC